MIFVSAFTVPKLEENPRQKLEEVKGLVKEMDDSWDTRYLKDDAYNRWQRLLVACGLRRKT